MADTTEIPGLPPQFQQIMNSTMGQAIAGMKGIQPQIVWDCLEVSNPKELPALLARQGKIMSAQVFVCDGKLYVLFGRI